MSTLRAVHPADAALLADLHAQCFAEPWSEASFLSLLQQDTCLGFLGTLSSDAEPKGFVLVQVVASECEILTIGVVAERRGSGLGRSLVEHAAMVAQARGAREMFLEVADGNKPARALYAGLGFGALASRKAYYRNRDGTSADALLLRGALPLPVRTRG